MVNYDVGLSFCAILNHLCFNVTFSSNRNKILETDVQGNRVRLYYVWGEPKRITQLKKSTISWFLYVDSGWLGKAVSGEVSGQKKLSGVHQDATGT